MLAYWQRVAFGRLHSRKHPWFIFTYLSGDEDSVNLEAEGAGGFSEIAANEASRLRENAVHIGCFRFAVEFTLNFHLHSVRPCLTMEFSFGLGHRKFSDVLGAAASIRTVLSLFMDMPLSLSLPAEMKSLWISSLKNWQTPPEKSVEYHSFSFRTQFHRIGSEKNFAIKRKDRALDCCVEQV